MPREVDEKVDFVVTIKIIWKSIAGVWLWFNLVTTPFILLWPELHENKTLWYALWANELVWVLDMMRKLFDKPDKSKATDVYEIAVGYLKSVFILDLIASFPSIASGLNADLAFLKLSRIYQIWLLHYPFEAIVNLIYNKSDKRHKFVIVYACSTVSKIMILLHYLAITFLWIGSDAFRDYEARYLPWQLAISDFEGYSSYKLYIFSVYWVCTVITTVGYGDYAGGTTLELLFTIVLEFLGLVVFSVL